MYVSFIIMQLQALIFQRMPAPTLGATLVLPSVWLLDDLSLEASTKTCASASVAWDDFDR